MTVVFCHGLESRPHGRKYQALRAAGLDVVAPDCQGQELEARVATIAPALRDGDVVVGSSYGGIAGLCAAIRHVEAGGRLRGLLLCAPALLPFPAPPEAARVYPPTRTIVIHGRGDDVVPPRVSVEFAAAHPAVQLVLVDDAHDLAGSLDLIVAATRALLAEAPLPA